MLTAGLTVPRLGMNQQRQMETARRICTREKVIAFLSASS
jgi:hypothetical protein